MSNEIAEVQSQDLNVVTHSGAALILDSASMDSMYRMAEVMAKAKSTIPDHLKGNVGDCMAIVMQSISWGMNCFAVAQKTHTVNGVLGYEAQLVNAVIQSSGVTEDRFNYEWYGPWENIIGKTKVVSMPAKDGKKAYEFRVPDYSMTAEKGIGIRVWATLKGEVEPRIMDLLLEQASVRNSPLWATDPKQQLAYLAVKRWTRLYAPDVILGVYTRDELEDGNKQAQQVRNMGNADVVAPEVPQALLKQAAEAADKGVIAYQQFWTATGKENRQLLGYVHESNKQAAIRADSERTIEPKSDVVDADFVAAMDKESGEYVQGGDVP